MNTVKIIFNAIEWQKVLYLMFVILLTKYCFLYGFGYDTTLSIIDIILFALTCGFFYKATFLLSYYFKSNSKALKIYKPAIKYTAFIFISIGVLLGVFLSIKINQPHFLFIILICGFLAIVYSRFAKEKSFLNNIIKSFLLPFAIFCVFFLDTPINLTVKEWETFLNLQFITIIYLILTFIDALHQENLKDFSTIKEDNANNLKTLPILFGRKRAKDVSYILVIFIGILIVYLTVSFITISFLFKTFLFLNIAPYLVTTYFFFKAKTAKDYIQLLKISKYISVIGILGILAIAYYFKYVA